MMWTKVKIVAGCLLALGTLIVGGVLARQMAEAGGKARQGTSAPAAKADKPDKQNKPPNKAEKPRPKEKTYEFDFGDKSWKEIIDWYVDVVNVPFVGSMKPKGKPRFIAPKGKRKYTREEITDLLSELFLVEGYNFIVRSMSCTLIPVDEPIQDKPGTVALDDLKKMNKTAFVAVILPLTTLKAKELSPEVKKLLGPSGTVVAYEKANKLLLIDRVGNLLRIHQIIQAIDTKAPRPTGTETTKAPRPKEKTYTFQVRNQPWAKVLEWYAEVSGLPYVGKYRPTGTFSFIPPRGKRKYTLGEITDLLNESLRAQEYILVRRKVFFTLRPADEKIDPALVPLVRLDDLPKRAKTELVMVVLPLTSLVVEDIVPEVKQLLGPFGSAVAFKKANRLVLQDTAANLRRIHRVIKELEAQEKKKRDGKER
jgi:type II secretory pathway component GspD/PulD (secretin)